MATSVVASKLPNLPNGFLYTRGYPDNGNHMIVKDISSMYLKVVDNQPGANISCFLKDLAWKASNPCLSARSYIVKHLPTLES